MLISSHKCLNNTKGKATVKFYGSTVTGARKGAREPTWSRRGQAARGAGRTLTQIPTHQRSETSRFDCYNIDSSTQHAGRRTHKMGQRLYSVLAAEAVPRWSAYGGVPVPNCSLDKLMLRATELKSDTRQNYNLLLINNSCVRVALICLSLSLRKEISLSFYTQ